MDVITMMNKLGFNVEIESVDAKNGIVKGVKISTSYEMTDSSYKLATESMTMLIRDITLIVKENLEKQEATRNERYAKESELTCQREQERIRESKASADCEELRKKRMELELKELESRIDKK